MMHERSVLNRLHAHAQGQVVGTMKVSLDDKPYGEFPVVAIDGVPVAGIFGRAIDTIRLWFN